MCISTIGSRSQEVAIRTWYDGVGYSLVTEIGPTLVGDYNDDGIVDAADYVVWRKNLGMMTTLPNRDTANGGAISMDDFDSWRENFGNTALRRGRNSVSTPEPDTFILAILIIALTTFARDTKSK